MKSLLIAMLATLALSGQSFADERGKEARKAHEEAQREHAKDRREAEKEYWKDRREADKEYRKDLKEERKAYRRWARGEHIPRDYLVESYYIRDYRDYDLAPPPPGYMWVRPYEDDDTYYMVQLANGLISQIFGN
jgi:Ni/Co efflux regulator RcnB